MDINTIVGKSPVQIQEKIASRIKERRLEKNLSQKDFAKRAGIGYDAYRRFENSGEISLRNLILCAIVLDEIDEISNLFTQRAYQSLDEIIDKEETMKRQRASKK